MVVKNTNKDNKFFVTLWGGLGDFLKIYYANNKWRCLEDFKSKRPNVKIKALVYSLNKSAKGLVECHPCIDEVFQPDMPLLELRKRGLGIFRGEHVLFRPGKIKGLKPTKPRIYLSESDKNFVNKTVKQAGKYIAIHPFSAMSVQSAHGRTTMAPDKYFPIVEGLGKQGYTVIILGKDRPRQRELFEFEADNVINLIDKTNVRTALALVKRSAGFIGTNSCFMCYAWLEKKRSFVITSYLWQDRIKKNGFTSRRWKQPQNKVIFLPKDRDSAPYNKIQREIVNWFK